MQEFKRQYENAILRGQDAGSSDKERQRATEKITELTNIVNQCLIRRTNQILTKYLPVKFEMVVCVKMSELQTALYKSFLSSDSLRKNLLGNSLALELKRSMLTGHSLFHSEKSVKNVSLTALSNITNLKKLCNHPDLVFEKISEGADGFENAARILPANYNKK